MTTTQEIRDYLRTLPPGAEFSSRDLAKLGVDAEGKVQARKNLGRMYEMGELELVREVPTGRGGGPMKIFRVKQLKSETTAKRYCKVREWLHSLPADVQERSPMFEEVEDILRSRIAELERKCAEQQATVVKLYEMFGKELPNSAEELNGLLAKARAEAVPEGWQVIPTDPQWFVDAASKWDFTKGYGAKFLTRFFAFILEEAPKPGADERGDK